MSTLDTYLPQDRRRALSRGETLPDRTTGSALFADISGFTSLTETLSDQLGKRRGVEELTRQINAVYDALIAQIENYGGSVIGFAGDSITCWFDGDGALRAVTAALAMQAAIAAYTDLGLKVVVTSGPARRFEVGDLSVQRLDTIAGATIARLSSGGHLAATGEVLIDTATASELAGNVSLDLWRAAENGDRFAPVQQIPTAPQPTGWDAPMALEASVLQSWVLPVVFEGEQGNHSIFLTELRPVVALFLRFDGIAYDNDEAGEQLTALVSHVQTVLARHEGTLLDVTIGDKGSYLYAVFGTPITHEDDARRCVQAAIELQGMPVEFRFLQPLQIGISSGTMRVGAYGGSTRRTYGALGDDTNVAARLMTMAMPGEVLISGQVQKKVADLVSFEPRPPLPLKGKAEPIPVFAVTGHRRKRAIRLEEPYYALPMMGRQTALALVGEKLHLALQGQGQVIGITAEAGLGKSRLVAEVIRLAHKRGFTGYGGACGSSGINTPYLAWKPIWQAFFDVDANAPLRRQIRHLEDEIEDRTPLRVQAIPVLSPLLDIPIDDNDFTRTLEPKDRRNLLTAILEECLKSAAAEGPQLIVLEDVHWVDALSHDLLEALARASAKLPVCFVLAYRTPEVLRLQAPRVESLPYFTLVTLDKLTFAEAEQLIRAKLAQLFPARGGALPQLLVTHLTNQAEGNPFYIEELLNFLHDRGINPYEQAALNALELPSSLHALILSRIDRLSETEKVTLKTASIIGRLFSLRWLHGYYPALGDAERVKADLATLARLDLTSMDTPEPELAYLFKHIVIREVTYESLTYAMRARLHEQLAQFIEMLGADRYLDLLAFHYSRSENKVKQRDYLRRAGDAAQAAFANEAALEYFAHLLPLLDDPRARLELHLKTGAVFELLGRWAEAEAEYRAALAISEEITDTTATARCQRKLGVLFGLQGQYSTALAWLERACDAFTTLNDQTELALTQIDTGRVWFLKGEYPRARQELGTGLTLARGLADKPATALALNNLGNVAAIQGDFSTARHLYTESLALRQEMDDKRGISGTLGNLALVASRQGDYTTANRLFQDSLTLRRKTGDTWGISSALNNLGNMAHFQGDFVAAQALHEESLTLNQRMGDRSSVAGSLNNLGNLAIEQSDADTAKELYRESLSICKEIGDKRTMVYNLSGLAAVAAHSVELLQAARLAAASEKLRLDIRQAWEPVGGRIYERTVATARSELGEAAFKAAWTEGEQMTLDEAIACALAQQPM